MIPDNQLGRRIQFKSILGLGVEPPVAGVGGEDIHKPDMRGVGHRVPKLSKGGKLGGQSPLSEFIFYFGANFFATILKKIQKERKSEKMFSIFFLKMSFRRF